MSSFVAFTPNDGYDRDHASDGASRYGAYLRRNLAVFLDADDKPTSNPLEFAAAAWRVAQPPVMSPPYITAHPRVLEAVATTDYEGRLSITVCVAASVPREIATSLRGWRYGHADSHSSPTASSVLQLRVPITADGLPDPAYTATADPDTDTAKHTVDILCGRLNAALSGVFTQLTRKEAA